MKAKFILIALCSAVLASPLHPHSPGTPSAVQIHASSIHHEHTHQTPTPLYPRGIHTPHESPHTTAPYIHTPHASHHPRALPTPQTGHPMHGIEPSHTHQARQANTVCVGTNFSNPQCCQTSAVDVAALDCDVPGDATTVDAFRTSCGEMSKAAKCCGFPVAGQAVACVDAPARPDAA